VARCRAIQEVSMLEDREAMPTVAVKDLAAARSFYEGTLGLVPEGGEGPEVVLYNTGGGRLVVYRSQFAGTNQATAVTWSVGDGVDDLARALKAKGVRFERYDFPGAKMDGDVHVMDGLRVAWFKDPDGNIHSLVSG
jgi:catechol 2,3-dioxygenase-like lactoylglutathione lyase family enzyme